MLVNFTNHPQSKWGADQIAAAKERFGEIIDMPFPAVPEDADESAVETMAERVVDEIVEILADRVADETTVKLPTQGVNVLVQGEFTLAFSVIARLQKEGMRCHAACSKRETIESQAADGSTVKNAVFRFVRFREYVNLRSKAGEL